MSAHTFETIIFIVASTAVVCTVVAFGALINHYLMLRRLKNVKLTARTVHANAEMQNTIQKF